MRRFRSHWEDQLWKALRILELAAVVVVVFLLGLVLLNGHWAIKPFIVSAILNIILAVLVLWRSWLLGDSRPPSEHHSS